MIAAIVMTPERSNGPSNFHGAQAHAISEFEKYRIVQDHLYVSDFDVAVQKLGRDAP